MCVHFSSSLHSNSCLSANLPEIESVQLKINLFFLDLFIKFLFSRKSVWFCKEDIWSVKYNWNRLIVIGYPIDCQAYNWTLITCLKNWRSLFFAVHWFLFNISVCGLQINLHNLKNNLADINVFKHKQCQNKSIHCQINRFIFCVLW